METKEIKDVLTSTLENNKLIAEFMGGKMIVENYCGINIIEFTQGKTFDLKGLKYQTSWDWLMPVCERFFELAPVDLDGFDDINNALHDSLWGLNINPFYKAIIIAIKWYNLNK